MRAPTRFPFLILFVVLCAPTLHAQNAVDTTVGVLHVRHLVGMQHVKHDSVGLLQIRSNELHFDAGRSRGVIPISAIEDIYVGTETTQAGGRLGQVAKGAAMAAPYDSGAALTLLMIQKVDVLTITYRDSDNGLHAAIFALPKERAEQFHLDLISKSSHSNNGAKTSRVPRDVPAPKPAPPGRAKSQTVSAILVQPVNAGDVSIPAAFRLAIYERLIEKIQESGTYARVYRSGDRRADVISGLVTLSTEVEKFKEGNQAEREMVTVLGATKVKVSAKLSTRDGAMLLNTEVEGKVRFFGENLGVTSDVAKRVAELLKKTP